MATYLIDYENTGVKGLHGIETLKEEDLIVIFYGPKTGAVPFDEHVRISSSVAHVEYFKTTKTAKNYLDFQLTTYLGYLIAQTGVKQYYVISKDSGYDSVIDFWKLRGIQIRRQENIMNEVKPATTRRTTMKQSGKPAGRQIGKTTVPTKVVPTSAATGVPATEVPATGVPATAVPTTTVPTTTVPTMPTAKSTVTLAGKPLDTLANQNLKPADNVSTAVQTAQSALKPEMNQTQAVSKPVANQTEQAAPKAATNQMVQAAPKPVTNQKTQRNPKTPLAPIPENIKKKIRMILKPENLQGGTYKQIYSCMLRAKDKQSFNTALVHVFTQEEGNHYYKVLLAIFMDWISKREQEQIVKADS